MVFAPTPRPRRPRHAFPASLAPGPEIRPPQTYWPTLKPRGRRFDSFRVRESDFTILVCDDEPHIRQIVAQKLAGVGFKVHEAKNGRQALEAITGPTALRPNLIISDFQMPELNGMELCTLLKITPGADTTPVLMLTARGYVLSKDDLSKTNIREVIAKPFGVRQLLDRVRAMLGFDQPAKAA